MCPVELYCLDRTARVSSLMAQTRGIDLKGSCMKLSKNNNRLNYQEFGKKIHIKKQNQYNVIYTRTKEPKIILPSKHTPSFERVYNDSIIASR